MSKREPQTREEIDAAADKWLSNIVGWKRRYVEGLKNEVLDLRDKARRAMAKLHKHRHDEEELKLLRRLVEHQDKILIACRTQRPPSSQTLDGAHNCRKRLRQIEADRS